MNTPEQDEQPATKLEAEALALRRQAQQPREQQQAGSPNLKAPDISPRTKLPVEHPESQAVERIHYDMQTSLCGRPMTEAEADALLKDDKKKDE